MTYAIEYKLCLAESILAYLVRGIQAYLVVDHFILR